MSHLCPIMSLKEGHVFSDFRKVSDERHLGLPRFVCLSLFRQWPIGLSNVD